MNIKVEKVNHVQKLFEVIDSCTMNVELVTGEGDCLNMKSKLSQYLSMTRMFANGDVPQMEFVAKNDAAEKLSCLQMPDRILWSVRHLHVRDKGRPACFERTVDVVFW